jgi:hypothetical protein
MPVFINNGPAHLDTLEVYEDGSINCWGMVDLRLFRRKLRAGWVSTRPASKAQEISVFEFGRARFQGARWERTARDLDHAVVTALRQLRPPGGRRVDMKGSETRRVGGLPMAKLGISFSSRNRFRVDARTGRMIQGDSSAVLRVLPKGFELTRLVVYRDGRLQLGEDPALIRLSQLGDLFAQGVIANRAPQGSRVVVPGLGSFVAAADFGRLTPQDRILELEDKLREMRGRLSIVILVRRAFRGYQRRPTAKRKERLRELYERVPTHMRIYCGDMDTLDLEIRAVLYGETRQLEMRRRGIWPPPPEKAS